MVSDSAVGATWTALSAPLLTEVVRGEWGFAGAVITDMRLNANSAMITRMLSAGCDMLMSSKNDKTINMRDYTSGATQALIRRAVKNVCYTQVNSALMQGISSGSIIKYSVSPWKKALTFVNLAVGLILLAGIAFLCLDWIRTVRTRHGAR